MNLRFVEGGGLASRVIRFTTRCKWSHVELISADGLSTFGAQLKGGVRWRSIDDPCYRHSAAYEIHEITSTAPAEAEFWQFLSQQNDKPYDWRAICSFGLGSRDWREDDSWFCSELVARGLELAGILTLPTDIPVWRITPRDLWVLVAGVKAAAVGVAA